MLARYGLLGRSQSTPPAPASLRRLSDLLALLRHKLIAHRDALRKLRSEVDCDALGAAVVQALDAGVQACIDADDTLSLRVAILRSITGLGPLNAASLCADMPELGATGRRQAAALVGVAPCDHESGRFQGTRRCRGGRAHPRKLLYMAATSAVRYHPGFQASHQRFRDHCTWQPQTLAKEVIA